MRREKIIYVHIGIVINHNSRLIVINQLNRSPLDRNWIESSGDSHPYFWSSSFEPWRLTGVALVAGISWRTATSTTTVPTGTCGHGCTASVRPPSSGRTTRTRPPWGGWRPRTSRKPGRAREPRANRTNRWRVGAVEKKQKTTSSLYALPRQRFSLICFPPQLSERARERKVPVTRLSRLANFGGTVTQILFIARELAI